MQELLLEFPNSRLYAILDMARRGGIKRFAQEFRPRPRCLLAGHVSPGVARVTPHLVQLRPGDGSLKRLIQRGWGQDWGIVLSSSLDTEELLDHLARQLIIEHKGERLFFRYYDPRVLRKELSGDGPGRLRALLGGVHHLAVESEDGRSLWLHSVRGKQLHRWDLRCEVSREHALAGGKAGDSLPPLEELEQQLSSARAQLDQEEQALEALAATLDAGGARLRSRLERKEQEVAAASARLKRHAEQTRVVEQQRAATADQLERHQARQQAPGQDEEPPAGGEQDAFSALDSYYRSKGEADRIERQRKRVLARGEPGQGDELARLEHRLEQVRGSLKEQQQVIEEQKRRAEERAAAQQELDTEGARLLQELERLDADGAHHAARRRRLERRLRDAEGEAETLRRWLGRGGLAGHRDSAVKPEERLGTRKPLQERVERSMGEQAQLGARMEQARLGYNRAVQEHNRRQRQTPGEQRVRDHARTLQAVQELGQELVEHQASYRAGLLRSWGQGEELLEQIAEQLQALGALQLGAREHGAELAQVLDPPAQVQQEGPQPFEEAPTMYEPAPPKHEPEPRPTEGPTHRK